MDFKKRFFVFIAATFIFILNESVTAKNILSMKTDSSDVASNEDSGDSLKRIFSAQLEFGNDKVSNGIKGTTTEPYLQPSFFYQALSGFNCGFLANYLFNEKSFDQFNLYIGYDFKLFKVMDAGAGLTKFFYTTNSPQATASVSGNLDFFLKHDFKIIESQLNFDWDFLKTTKTRKGQNKSDTASVKSSDFSFTLTNLHSFDFDELFSDNDGLSIIPTIAIRAGTQNIYQQYALSDKFLKNHPLIAQQIQNSQIQNDNTSKFTLTSIEFELPVEYSIGKFRIEPSGHYVIPKNQPSYLNETNYFYFTVLAGFDF